MQEIVVIDGEISLENTLDGEVELEAITDLDPEVVLSTGGAVYPHYDGSYTVTPSSSVQTLDTSDKVMDDDVTVQAVQAGSATTPATIITADPTISVSSGGLITAQVNKTQQITPTVQEGYVEAGTAGNVGVSGSNTEQLSVQGAQTIHPASTDQSIASGKYLTGAQTFKAVTVSGLTADKVLQGNTVEIGDADDSDRIMKVVGTAQGGITPTGTKNITANGTNIDVYNYQYADVAVPNSYSASDEGKVVSNGALVAQTSDSVTQNGTVDTTLINSLTVNVSGGGGIDINDWVTGTAYAQDTAVITVDITRSDAFSGAPFKKVVWDYSRSSNLNSCARVFDNGKMEAVIFTGFTGSLGSSSSGWMDRCTALTTFDAPMSGIHASQFANCSALDTLILRKSSGLVTLANNALNATKFKSGGAGGTIYIPKALYDHLGDNSSLDYKKATNWATYEGYGTITWAKIEGSVYESTTWWQ